MTNDIKEILDKLKNRKEVTLLAGLRECQLKNIEHVFITKEEYIDKVLDYITNLQHTKEYLGELLHEQNLELEEEKRINQEDLKYIDKLEERIEKAVEYIKNCPEYLWANVNTKELLNILNGKGSDE